MNARLSSRERLQIIATVCLGAAAITGICALLLLAQAISLTNLLRSLTFMSAISAAVTIVYLGARRAPSKAPSR